MSRFSKATIEEIERVAAAHGIDAATLLAVCDVESGGRAFAVVNNRQEPLIRFEGHYFDRLLTDAARAKARLLGLASPRVGSVKNPRSQSGRWALLARARLIDDAAALQSCSWGIGQVMGAHWKDLGFSSPQGLVREARSGVAGQVKLMVRFIEKNGLLSHLERRDWAGFARRYNGPAYRRNRYDEKMASAYRRYKNDDGIRTKRVHQGIIRRGMRGAEVRDLQRQLLAAGYPVAGDGVFGPKTEQAVKRFQQTRDIIVDGIVGPQTKTALLAKLSKGAQSTHWIATFAARFSKLLPVLRFGMRLWRWTR